MSSTGEDMYAGQMQTSAAPGHTSNGVLGNHDPKNDIDIYDLEVEKQIELTHRMQMLNGRYYFSDNTATHSIYEIKQDFQSWNRRNHYRSCAHTINQDTFQSVSSFGNKLINSNLESFMSHDIFKVEQGKELESKNNNNDNNNSNVSEENKHDNDSNNDQKEENKKQAKQAKDTKNEKNDKNNKNDSDSKTDHAVVQRDVNVKSNNDNNKENENKNEDGNDDEDEMKALEVVDDSTPGGMFMGMSSLTFEMNDIMGKDSNSTRTTVVYEIKGEVSLNNRCLEMTQDFMDSVDKLMDQNNDYYNWKEMVSDFGDYFVSQAWIGQKTWTIVDSRGLSTPGMTGQIGNSNAVQHWKLIKILKVIDLKDVIKQYLIENRRNKMNMNDKSKSYSKQEIDTFINEIEKDNEKYVGEQKNTMKLMLEQEKLTSPRYNSMDQMDVKEKELEKKENDKLNGKKNESNPDCQVVELQRIRLNCFYKLYALKDNVKCYFKIDSKGFIHANPDNLSDPDLIVTFLDNEKGQLNSQMKHIGKKNSNKKGLKNVSDINVAEDKKDKRDIVEWRCCIKNQFNKYLAAYNGVTEVFFKESKDAWQFELYYIDHMAHYLQSKYGNDGNNDSGERGQREGVNDSGLCIQLRTKHTDIKFGGYKNTFQMSISREIKKQFRLVFRRWNDLPPDTVYLEKCE